MVYTVYSILCNYTLHSVVICDQSQIFLTLRLDDDIDWSYAAVLTPLLAWVMLTVLAHVYEVNGSTTVNTCRM